MLPVTGSWEPSCSYKQSIVCDCLCWALVCAGKVLSCVPRLAFTSTKPLDRSAKVPRHPKTQLHHPPSAGCLLGLVTQQCLNTTGCDEREYRGEGDIAFPQAPIAQKGVLNPIKIASTIWEND